MYHWGGLAACYFVEEVFDAGILRHLGHGVVDLQRLLEMDGLADGFPGRAIGSVRTFHLRRIRHFVHGKTRGHFDGRQDARTSMGRRI